MNQRSLFVLPALLLIACSGVCSGESVSLFDGETLSGFEADPNHWSVVDGAIVGEIKPGTRLNKNTWLVWKEGELVDFELRFQFRLTGAPGANSGVQIRCQVDSVDHVSGYQADLDQGDVWLGRIYDEHGRALLVERGSRVHILPDGERKTAVFAPKNQYQVLVRENAWNDYRIVAVGDRIDVYINGTLFSQLRDEQVDQHDLRGSLAFQLHSGGETKIAFRDIQLESLTADDLDRLAPFDIPEPEVSDANDAGVVPSDSDGKPLNLGFESGSLNGWTVDGKAFAGQPVNQDGISSRWRDQISNKAGDFFVGGFELHQDAATGTLTSAPFEVTHPYGSFLIGGGNTQATRVEIVTVADDGARQTVFTATGDNREQMRRVVADLRSLQGATIAVRLIDESSGGWGHLNFDDFRFHDTPPVSVEPNHVWRSTFNPLLQHLVPNPTNPSSGSAAADTLAQMHVPNGFSVDAVAAEPIVHQPIAFTFDVKGRLWIVEGHSYPQKRPEGEGLDRVIILEDRDGDGSFETRKVFTEGLNLVSGLEVGHGGVWIGAAPQLLFIPDRDGDDRPDAEPVVLLDGFGYGDTHETLNSFLWGPDGWLYGNQGVFNSSRIGKPGQDDSQRVSLAAGVWRYHPTRHEFEVFAHGGSNQWGLDYDQHGQLFMTHCRSHWGQGATTHVMRNGHYWNQVNGGYAPFISSSPLPGMPHMKNFLLASARYGHGEGGAGKRGSREVYGGHSHVGTMIYLGDNWPEQYRNHLFTVNLHGHQINHQINRRLAGGYNTVHAGTDVLFCGDQQFVGVDLKVGPDGAVYVSDWYDPRHCHNPNLELWDRGNGRVYRMKYDDGYQPIHVDYAAATDDELIAAQRHRNDWHARAARMVLAERAGAGRVSDALADRLRTFTTQSDDPVLRLRGLWTLQVTGNVDGSLIQELLDDDSEYVRGWAIQLACQSLPATAAGRLIREHAASETSAFVQRYLASALPDLDPDDAWGIAETLASKEIVAGDRDLPLLLWQGIAPRIDQDLERALTLASHSQVAALRDNILWYVAKNHPRGRTELVKRIASAEPAQQIKWLTLLSHALAGSRNVEGPSQWRELSGQLYASSDNQIRFLGETIGAAFGDAVLYQRMRSVVDDHRASQEARGKALSILASDASAENLNLLLKLLDEPDFATAALSQLAKYDDDRIATQVLQRLPRWNGTVAETAMELLCGRSDWATLLLDAIADGSIDKSRLTAYYANQMANLGDASLTDRLSREWGRLAPSSAEVRTEIQKTLQAYQTAPLWAYNAVQGQQHFKRLCAACHQPEQADERIAPKLEGTRSKGIAYAIENVIDPNAVIGRDYQARVILTSSAQVITGLVQKETPTAITVKTANHVVTVDRDDIESMRISENSFMPTGLLNTLNDRERIELFKYIMSL